MTNLVGNIFEEIIERYLDDVNKDESVPISESLNIAVRCLSSITKSWGMGSVLSRKSITPVHVLITGLGW